MTETHYYVMINALTGSTVGVVLPPPLSSLYHNFQLLRDVTHKRKTNERKQATGLYPPKGHTFLKKKR